MKYVTRKFKAASDVSYVDPYVKLNTRYQIEQMERLNLLLKLKYACLNIYKKLKQVSIMSYRVNLDIE
jgi:hypothetical protein